MILIRLGTLACALLLVVGAVVAEDKPDPREQLATAITEGIRLLEAKDYERFLQDFVPPEDFKRITQKRPLVEFAAGFGQEKATQLLEVLKEIKDAKPMLDEAGNKATFAINEEIAGKKTVTFRKVEKYWYIQN